MARTTTFQPEGHPEPHATEARQGSLGRHVLLVLLISTLLAAAVLFISLTLQRGGFGEDGAGPAVTDSAQIEAVMDPVP